MIKLARQKSFKKKYRKKINFFSNSQKLSFKPKLKSVFKFIRIFISIFTFIYVCFYIFNNTLFKSEYLVQKVNYSKNNIEKFDDPVLYKIIRVATVGENYYVIKYIKKKEILNNIKEKFPIVKDIEFSNTKKNNLDVNLTFDNVDFRFKLLNDFFAVYSGNILLLFSGNTLGSTGIIVELPSYLSGLNNLNGIFFGYSYDKFFNNIGIIIQYFGTNIKLLYIPGSRRIVVSPSNNKNIYINLLKDVKIQLDYYDFMKNNYEGFSNLTQLDIGSLEGNMVIIKQ